MRLAQPQKERRPGFGATPDISPPLILASRDFPGPRHFQLFRGVAVNVEV